MTKKHNRLSPEAIDRILSNTFSKRTKEPLGIDRRALAEELEWAGAMYVTTDGLSRLAVQNAREKLIKSIDVKLGQLQILINKDWSWLSLELSRHSNKSPSALLRQLPQTLEAAQLAVRASPYSREDYVLEAPMEEFEPLLVLIGELKRIYERFFGVRAAAGNQGGYGKKPSGPFVRFAESAMNELGFPYGAHSIRKALKAIHAKYGG